MSECDHVPASACGGVGQDSHQVDVTQRPYGRTGLTRGFPLAGRAGAADQAQVA